MRFQALEDTDQAIHVQVPEVNFSEGISFGHFRTIFFCREPLFWFFRSITVSEECSACWFDTRIAERLRVPAARDKHPPCFQLRRGFRDRLRWGKNRGIRVPGKLRPEWEMDNFFCSHRGTSTVRQLVRGAFGVSSTNASRYVTLFFPRSCSFDLGPRENDVSCIS
jgi:hypothetical protein